jgi:peptide/nickel transport system substrate-binding protein
MLAISRRPLLTAAAAALAAPPALAQQPRDLTIAVQGIPPTLEPGMDFSNVGWRVFANLYDTLIGYDFKADFAPVPRLASSWQRRDDRTLDLVLRPDARFHDGSPVTAEDVAFSFGVERMRGEDAPTRSIVAPFLGVIQEVTALAPDRVRVVASQPDPLLELRLASIPSSIISKRAYLATSFQQWQLNPVGSGPYRLRSMRSGNDLVLEAMPDHWSGKPPVRSLRYWVVPEVAGRISAVRSNAAQIATDIPPDQEAELRGSAEVDFVGGMIANHRVLSYDTTNPVLRDPRVRRALSLAIDRELIASTLWGGRVTVPHSHQFPAFRDMFLADVPVPAHDPAQARALLAEAGYKGEPIEYRFIGYGYYTNEVQTAQVLAEMWRGVGVNIRLVSKENFSQVLNDPGRGIRNWSNTMTLPDPVGGLWRLYGTRGPVQGGYKEWRNEAFNALGATLETSGDLRERQATWRRMLEIYDRTDPPGTVLHQFALFYVKRREVNWTPVPVEWMDFRASHLSYT